MWSQTRAAPQVPGCSVPPSLLDGHSGCCLCQNRVPLIPYSATHLPARTPLPSSCTCSSEEHIPTACCILPPSHTLFGLCPWHTPQVPGGNELACLVHNGILCTWYPACHITGADEKLSSWRNVHHKKKKKKNRSHQVLSYEAMC